MSRRGRAILFIALAVGCAVASASIATGYREGVEEQLGEVREVVVATMPLRAGVKLTRRLLAASTELRPVPIRFLPPDVIAAPSAIRGRRLGATVPGGSYLLISHLRGRSGRPVAGARTADGRSPVDVVVAGAGSVPYRAGGTRVDVVVAAEPITGGRRRVRVAAEGVELLGLERLEPGSAPDVGEDAWRATLALTRAEALELIEAENFARQIRIIPSGAR